MDTLLFFISFERNILKEVHHEKSLLPPLHLIPFLIRI